MSTGAAGPDRAALLARLGRDGAAETLRRMHRVRQFEEAAETQVKRGEIKGAVHLSTGQEGVSVGVCMAAGPESYVTGTHRSHGHPIAKGAKLDRLMAELYGSSAGVCHGKGGSMHLADFSAGCLGESAVVASSLPVAAGAGLASRLKGDGRVTLAFFGDGASNAGTCHESMNLAGAWKLPVVYVCENNVYAGTTPNTQTSAVPHVADRASAYGMPGWTVDGQDVLAVYGAALRAVERARAGEGPSIVEGLTYMYGRHAVNWGDKIGGIRPAGEMDDWLGRDPLRLFATVLREHGVLTEAEIAAVRDEVAAEVAAAVEFARQGPPAAAAELWPDMYVDASAWGAPEQTADPAPAGASA